MQQGENKDRFTQVFFLFAYEKSRKNMLAYFTHAAAVKKVHS